MENLRCVVERITYQNPQNGYAVLKCRVKGFQDLVKVVGEMPEVHVGSVLSLSVVWNLADIANALMAIPNLIALLLLSGVAAQETKKYLWNNRLDDEMDEEIS